MNGTMFLKQCKKNREILDLTYQDISNALIDMSAKEYEAFEKGKSTIISKENIKRLYRILCIEEVNTFNLSDYIDTEGLTKEEIVDLAKIAEKLVGEVDA